MSLKDIISALSKSRFGPLLGFILLANIFLLLGASLNKIFSGPDEVTLNTDCPAIVQDVAQLPQDSQVPGSVPDGATSMDPAAAC